MLVSERMTSRLAYLDNLKILLVVGVITMHVAVTYGFDGNWYLESYDEMGVVIDVLTPFLAVGWLFGLGLFFLIAGRLSSPSLDRKGPKRFMQDRLIRLGIPLLAYMLVISPVLEYVDHRENENGSESLLEFLSHQVWEFGPGPMWFLEALLVFSAGYALLRTIRSGRGVSRPAQEPLRGSQVAVVAVAIAVASFTAHLVWPIGSEQLHLQLGTFPQYIVMFSLGAAAGRRGWLETLSPRLERRCGVAALLAAVAVPISMAAGGFFDGGAAADRFKGGWHWQAAAASSTEGILAVCVSVWAVGWFRRRQNYVRPLARKMAPAAYGAYVIHAPVIVGLALAIQAAPVPAELKFAVVLLAGVAGSFGLAALASRAGPAARIIGSVPRSEQREPVERPSPPAVARPPATAR
jgi:glucan biosynthesis protein C